MLTEKIVTSLSICCFWQLYGPFRHHGLYFHHVISQIEWKKQTAGKMSAIWYCYTVVKWAMHGVSIGLAKSRTA